MNTIMNHFLHLFLLFLLTFLFLCSQQILLSTIPNGFSCKVCVHEALSWVQLQYLLIFKVPRKVFWRILTDMSAHSLTFTLPWCYQGVWLFWLMLPQNWLCGRIVRRFVSYRSFAAKWARLLREFLFVENFSTGPNKTLISATHRFLPL